MRKAIIIALCLAFTTPCFAAEEKRQGPTETQIYQALEIAQMRQRLALYEAKAAQDEVLRLRALLKVVYRAQDQEAKK